MKTPSPLKSQIFLLPILLALAAFIATAPTAPAQGVVAPPPPSNATAPTAKAPAPAATAPTSNVTQTAATSGDYKSSTSEGMADRLFNVNSDSVDAENGTITWKGRTFSLLNSRAMRARFGRYLASPVPGEDARKYEATLRRIETLLSPGTINRTNYQANMQEAWNLLFEAAKFEADGDGCLTIANLVEKSARMREELRGLQITHNQQERLRQRLRDDLNSEKRIREEDIDETMRANSRRRNVPPPTRGTDNVMRKQENYAEKTAGLKATEGEMSGISLRVRLEFQSQIVTFLFNRRFHHTIISNAFYRQLFVGSSQNIRVGDKQIKEMFPVSNFTPTIDSLDMLAREAINDVDTGMKTVQHLYDSGERYGAFERLQETFFLGEYEMPVIFFELEKKRSIQELWQHLQNLQRLGDERDLTGIENILAKVKTLAQDFPAVQIMSRVNNAMEASNLAVLAAKQSALASDTAQAQTYLEKAREIWPTNPAIREFSTQIVNRANELLNKVPEFDRLLSGSAFRELYNRKEEFGIALHQDKERLGKLSEIVKQVGQIEIALLQVKALTSQGNNYTAWDVLQEARERFGEDAELGKAITEMAPAIANYARLLNDAARDERDGNLATSLASFLAAQDLNPNSETCRKGILRLSKNLLAADTINGQ
ncbi:MAG: hypothetical protein LBV28_04260 [Puniceicoccales bacterium]|jgi:hypothetical protein|nr:hypothetical protein [Puniceicoccales bacterium]